MDAQSYVSSYVENPYEKKKSKKISIEVDEKLMVLFRDKYMEYVGIEDETYCPDDATLLVVAINDCIDSMLLD